MASGNMSTHHYNILYLCGSACLADLRMLIRQPCSVFERTLQRRLHVRRSCYMLTRRPDVHDIHLHRRNPILVLQL